MLLHQLYERRLEAAPDATAVRWVGGELTYAGLPHQSWRDLKLVFADDDVERPHGRCLPRRHHRNDLAYGRPQHVRFNGQAQGFAMFARGHESELVLQLLYDADVFDRSTAQGLLDEDSEAQQLEELTQVSTVATDTPIVSSHTEWDPLEEVIVGVMDGASVPPWHISLKATMPERHWDFFQQFGGKPFPREMIEAANRDLEELVRVCEGEGVKVRRPAIADHSRPFTTPEWSSLGGLYAAMPRDVLLVVGNELIEAPVAWRSRYFEIHHFRPLLKEYFQAGAKWTAAPRPQLSDATYASDWQEGSGDDPYRWVVTEHEPTFDAADFFRCGHDIFYFASHVTNSFGVQWLRRHLGPTYRVHELHCNDRHRMHIDTTFCPLAPGKLLVNPDRVKDVPRMFKSWDILKAPRPCSSDDLKLYFSGKWLSMNVLMLDEERVVVARHEETLIRAFKDWGFKPIPCTFENFYSFGGSIHCATLDVRRRGPLRSYFDDVQ